MRGVETPSINWDFIKIYKQKTKMQNNLMVPMFYLQSGVVDQLLLIGLGNLDAFFGRFSRLFLDYIQVKF
jgi:hypothetical protein